MKYAILVGDGMSDWPIAELGGKTVLAASHKPNMDWIAKNGSGGRAITVPKGMEPGSDVANMSILGYNPKKYYSGRGPFEALSYGISVAEDEIAFRMNFVTVIDGVMVDYSAGHIKTHESKVFADLLNKEIGEDGIKFYAGVSYRNLLVIKKDLLNDGDGELRCVPPHDISGKRIQGYLPKGQGAKKLLSLMEKSVDILSKHELYQVKVDLKQNPANMIWLWGHGGKPCLPLFKDRFGVSGGIISAVGLLKGIGRAIGMEVINVPGATGYYDTDYNAKASYAIDALKRMDLIFVHVEAPDEAGHNGDLKNKILAVENFDNKVVGPMLEYMRASGDYRILVLPDHPTPVSIRTHAADPVPFAICGTGINSDGMNAFTEKEADNGGYGTIAGDTLGDMLCHQ
jgi:2,3-bisphosphoglycerate-independent phosphoglycerate mutase